MKPIVFCAALLANSGAVAAQIEYLGSYVWTEPGIGGMSGVEVLSETEMIALSDRGTLVTITTGRTDAGKIDAITGYNSVLLSPDAGPFDSEGLAIDPAGGAWLSFEGPARISKVSNSGEFLDTLPPAPSFSGMQTNAALEALAIDAAGNILTLAERSGRADRPYQMLRYSKDGWSTAFALDRVGAFLPVGADFGPDGLLYLLERDSLGLWFRSRIRRMAPDGSNVETIFQSGFGDFDNLEGISVWSPSNPDGGIRITLVSDNNFLPVQETQFVDFKLTD